MQPAGDTPSPEPSGVPPTPPAAPPPPPPSAAAPAPAVPPAPEPQEKWLWVDPLAKDDRTKSGSVLLDDVIKAYVDHGLLIEKSNYDEGKLKGGSYTMTPAAGEAWMFVPGKKSKHADQKIALDRGRDHIGDFYWVPRNSLVYIKLKQKLRLPFYLIGRHNLKIRYVYKGLLLGTGPQVDPGFEGNLFIPLHNFTTSDVKVYLEKPFVSIDFVRTTRFVQEGEVSAQNVDELRKELNGRRKLIDEEKVKKRTTLEDYLEGSTPRSQMAQFQFDFKELSNRVEGYLNRAKIWAFVERVGLMLGIAALVFTSLNYFRGYVADIRTETDRLRSSVPMTNVTSFLAAQSSAASNILSLQDRLSKLEAQLQLDKGKTNTMSGNVGSTGPTNAPVNKPNP